MAKVLADTAIRKKVKEILRCSDKTIGAGKEDPGDGDQVRRVGEERGTGNNDLRGRRKNMDILITKSYRKICCEIKYGIVQNCIATDAVFHIEARDITKEEEMDLLIRQLQQLRHEIADGCTKPTICPTEHLCQTE